MKLARIARLATLFSAATLIAGVLPACALGSADAPAEQAANTEHGAATEQALTATARAANFSCSGLGCTCSGDWDCNNMFDWGACGDWPAKCYERGPGPVYCVCAPWVRAQVAPGGVMSGGGVLTSAHAFSVK